jgi:hypothetical protein
MGGKCRHARAVEVTIMRERGVISLLQQKLPYSVRAGFRIDPKEK